MPALSSARRRNVVVSAAAVCVFVLVVGVVLAVSRPAAPSAPTAAGQAAELAARPDSNRLTSVPGSAVTFTEFLDFECEGCRAAFPLVEQLRQEYGDRVTFVVRYFPLPSHANADRAARAVEAAAQQGRFEAMYQLMFETQAEWGEQQQPMDSRFRGYAQQLGLDLERFAAAYDSPATRDRIDADKADGLALGVQGTPTFFVNGERLTPRGYADLAKALDAALDAAPAGS